MLGDLQCVRCGPVDQTSWIKKKKSVLAALYQKLKFLIASNWPKNGKREVFILGDPYYVRWIALQQTSRTKKEWPSSCFPSKIRGFESYYSLSCTHYHALMRMMRMRMMRMLMNHSLMTRENKQTNKNKQKQTNKYKHQSGPPSKPGSAPVSITSPKFSKKFFFAHQIENVEKHILSKFQGPSSSDGWEIAIPVFHQNSKDNFLKLAKIQLQELRPNRRPIGGYRPGALSIENPTDYHWLELQNDWGSC